MGKTHAEGGSMWTDGSLRPEGYNELHWVNAPSLRDPFLELIHPQPDETGVDFGCGTGAVLEHFAPFVQRAIGVDLSKEMLAKVNIAKHPNVELHVADATKGTDLAPSIADFVTARMMLHDLPDPRHAIHEAWSLVKPGGLFVAAEFVTNNCLPGANDRAVKYNGRREGSSLVPPGLFSEPTVAMLGLHRQLFALKHEPDRHLWTGSDFLRVVSGALPGAQEVSLHYGVAPDNSVDNWLGKSGFGHEAKQAGIALCLEADAEVREEANMKVTVRGERVDDVDVKRIADSYDSSTTESREMMKVDVLIPRAFAFVAVSKALEAS